MTSLAAAVVQECLTAGVDECCVCAGSRNSELVRLLLQAPLRVWHFFEERSAGFFALGRVRATGRPVAVVTTSGTAAAELFPSVIEAHYQGLPLLAITADRPRRFRGSGAPQSIEQAGLFGDYPSWQMDIESEDEAKGCLEKWPRSGPAHLNVCLEDPVHGLALFQPEQLPTWADFFEDIPLVSQPPIDLVLLGDLLPAERIVVRRLLENWRGPVWAEAASGLRAWLGNRLLGGGEAGLRRWQGRRILRLGGVPSCRFWRDLETRPDVDVISASRSGHSGLARESEVVEMESLEPLVGGEPCDFHAEESIAEKCAQFPLSECAHLRLLSQRIPSGSALFLGNSLCIRQWNLAAVISGAEANCHVMRGANGIDGNLSFFYGIGAECAESWAVVGDLTALYDLAAPWIRSQLPVGNRRIVIMNNGGGLIFRRLPSLKEMTDQEQPVIENTHEWQFSAWAEQWGLAYRKVTRASDWEVPLPDGDVVVEILPDAAQSEEFWHVMEENMRNEPIPTEP